MRHAGFTQCAHAVPDAGQPLVQIGLEFGLRCGDQVMRRVDAVEIDGLAARLLQGKSRADDGGGVGQPAGCGGQQNVAVVVVCEKFLH